MDGKARAPGWYPDPWGGDGERYFDGTSWSRHQHARPRLPLRRVRHPVVAVGFVEHLVNNRAPDPGHFAEVVADLHTP